MTKTKIALVEMSSGKGTVKDNLKKTLLYIQQAKEKQSNIIVFPEMSLTGYFTDEKFKNNCLALDSPEVNKIVSASKNITIIFGIAEIKDNRRFITQIIAQDGKIMGIYRKQNIKEAETILFSPGKETPTFSSGNIRYGVTICADIDLPRLYKEYANKGCNIVFECASPDIYGERENRNWEKSYLWWKNNCIEKIGNYAKVNKIHIAIATQSGKNTEDDFPGGGYLFSPDGKIIAETKNYKDDILYVCL